jgi:hypothetical protein
MFERDVNPFVSLRKFMVDPVLLVVTIDI